MDKVLSWHEIEQQYSNEWVQLVDYDWPEGDPVPLAGKVRIHAPTRREFNRQVLSATPVDAARLFVGDHKPPKGSIFSSNAVRVVACE